MTEHRLVRSSGSRAQRTLRAASIALAATLLGPAAAPGQPQVQQARAVVSETIDKVVAVLNDKTLPLEQKRQQIEEISYSRFDFDRMARLVLARNAQKLSPEQQQEFVAEFKRHLSTTYGRRLSEYSDERIEIGDARPETNGDVTVKSRVVGGAAGDGVAIDYRLKERDANWLVIDVIIEGVSLIHNFRSQVAEIVSSAGAESLIAKLREKNDRVEAEPAKP
jgi:phospholipid transport system substrate-binding protein